MRPQSPPGDGRESTAMRVKGSDVVSAVDGLALGKVEHMQCTRSRSQNSSRFCSVCSTRSLHVDVVPSSPGSLSLCS